jgi:hypothetical protein
MIDNSSFIQRFLSSLRWFFSRKLFAVKCSFTAFFVLKTANRAKKEDFGFKKLLSIIYQLSSISPTFALPKLKVQNAYNSATCTKRKTDYQGKKQIEGFR